MNNHRLTTAPLAINRRHLSWKTVLRVCLTLILLGVSLEQCVTTYAAAPASPTGPDPALRRKLVERGIRYLSDFGQAEDGSFSKFAGTGPTSLAITAMLRNGRSPKDPVVARGLGYLVSCSQSSGGIYGLGGMFGNYETCAAIMCLQQANQDGKYDEVLEKAEKFVRGMQWNESRDRESSDFYFGGAGYGGSTRPDLSNTAFLIDALKGSWSR